MHLNIDHNSEKKSRKIVYVWKTNTKTICEKCCIIFRWKLWKSIMIQKNNNENNGVKLNYAIFSPSRRFINLLNCRRIKFVFSLSLNCDIIHKRCLSILYEYISQAYSLFSLWWAYWLVCITWMHARCFKHKLDGRFTFNNLAISLQGFQFKMFTECGESFLYSVFPFRLGHFFYVVGAHFVCESGIE